jgi:hypothetical protein
MRLTHNAPKGLIIMIDEENVKLYFHIPNLKPPLALGRRA